MNDYLSKVQFGSDDALMKALSTAGGSGANLIPELVEPELRRFIITRAPIFHILRRKMWGTNAYIARDVSTLPTATFGTDGGALPSRTESTYNKPSVPMKYIYTTGEVTGPMQAASPVVDALQTEMELHSAALIRKVEQTLISGDSSGTPTEFDGMLKQITTNVVAGASAALTLTMLDEVLDKPDEYPTHFIVNRANNRRINASLQAQQRFTEKIEIGAGFRVLNYNDTPIIRVDNAITGLSTAVIAVNANWSTIAINRELFVLPLARTKDSDDFMIGMYLTHALEGEAMYHGKITGLMA